MKAYTLLLLLGVTQAIRLSAEPVEAAAAPAEAVAVKADAPVETQAESASPSTKVELKKADKAAKAKAAEAALAAGDTPAQEVKAGEKKIKVEISESEEPPLEAKEGLKKVVAAIPEVPKQVTKNNETPDRFTPGKGPEEFDAKKIPVDDVMYQTIKKHATEIDEKWVVKHDDAITMVRPIVQKYMTDLHGLDFDLYMRFKVEDEWKKFDVNKLGYIDVDWMGSFIKTCIGDHTLPLH